MNLYKTFKQLNLDTECIGLLSNKENGTYFCTPKGSEIIGWEGVDGIHYCMIPKYKDMVFCITPVESPGQYVHPVAASFQDFLSLLLSCGSTSVLSQAFCLTREEFTPLISQEARTTEQQSLLNELAHHFELSPILQPYDYIKVLQKEFDYSSLPFTKEYYDVIGEDYSPPSEWKVYYGHGFWEHEKGQRAGKEIPIRMHYSWAADTWYIPSIYSCSKGLVIDFCVQVSPSHIRTFFDKWNDCIQNGDVTEELQEQMELEHPLNRDVDFSIRLNGKSIPYDQYFSACWNPCIEDDAENDPESQLLCEHYQCDKSYGWIFIRAHFPWTTKRKVPIRSLDLVLKENPKSFAGPHFFSKDKEIPVLHPLTKKEYSLIIHSCTSEQLPNNALPNDEYEYPSHFQQVSYSIEPNLDPISYIIKDCNHGDSPRELIMQEDSFLPTAFCGVAVIGGSSGPTTLFLSNNSSGSKVHTACSSLYFEPVKNVEWRIVFQEKLRDDLIVPLL